MKLKSTIREKMKEVKFLKEGLGALEFTFPVTNENFEQVDVEFRFERVSADGFLRMTSKENDADRVKEILSQIIATPSEARQVKFYDLDSGAMSELVEVATAFQQTPLSFK